MKIINEEKKYRELKESIRMMNSQRRDVEKINLTQEDKKYVLMKLLRTVQLFENVNIKWNLICIKCRKDTKNINPKVSGTSNNKPMILSKWAICGSKKSRFIENQEVKGLLSNLVLKQL